MLEVIAAARALGFDVPDAFADQQIERTRTMGAYKASTLIDFERGQPLELQSLFLEPLRQATQAGVAMPRLSALCAVLKELDQTAPVALNGGWFSAAWRRVPSGGSAEATFRRWDSLSECFPGEEVATNLTTAYTTNGLHSSGNGKVAKKKPRAVDVRSDVDVRPKDAVRRFAGQSPRCCCDDDPQRFVA